MYEWSVLVITQFLDIFVFDSLLAFPSDHLKPTGEKEKMTLRVFLSVCPNDF